jgi:hypothetical protein
MFESSISQCPARRSGACPRSSGRGHGSLASSSTREEWLWAETDRRESSVGSNSRGRLGTAASDLVCVRTSPQIAGTPSPWHVQQSTWTAHILAWQELAVPGNFGGVMEVRNAKRALPAFDCGALFNALDTQRRVRLWSWYELADELWQQSSDLNALRTAHPLCGGAIQRLQTRGATIRSSAR